MQTIIVTGASSGIGAAIAEKFSQENYFVVLCGRNPDKLASVTKKLKGQSLSFSGDITDPRQQDLLVAAVAKEHLQIHCLVNNAGTFVRHSIGEMNPQIWQEQFQIHVLAAAELTRKLLPFLEKAAPSHILNISSGLGAKPSANLSAYCAMKAAQLSLTQSLAVELGPKKIRVNAILPGIVDTPIHDFHSLPAADKKSVVASLDQLHPIGRMGQVSDIAEAAYFLTSNKSAWTTGALLTIDGGLNLK